MGDGSQSPKKTGRVCGILSTRPATNDDRNLPIVRADATDDVMRNFERTRVDPSVFPPPAHHRARRRTSRIVRLVTPRSPSPGRLSTSPTRRFPRRSRSNARPRFLKCRPRPRRRFRAEGASALPVRAPRRAAPRRGRAVVARASHGTFDTAEAPGEGRGAGRVSPTRRTASTAWSSRAQGPRRAARGVATEDAAEVSRARENAETPFDRPSAEGLLHAGRARRRRLASPRTRTREGSRAQRRRRGRGLRVR